MATYIFNVYERDTDCTECTGSPYVVYSSTKKWAAQKFLKGALESGLSLMNFDITRSKDGVAGSTVDIDPYEFMQIDLGEVM